MRERWPPAFLIAALASLWLIPLGIGLVALAGVLHGAFGASLWIVAPLGIVGAYLPLTALILFLFFVVLAVRVWLFSRKPFQPTIDFHGRS